MEKTFVLMIVFVSFIFLLKNFKNAFSPDAGCSSCGSSDLCPERMKNMCGGISGNGKND